MSSGLFPDMSSIFQGLITAALFLPCPESSSYQRASRPLQLPQSPWGNLHLPLAVCSEVSPRRGRSPGTRCSCLGSGFLVRTMGMMMQTCRGAGCGVPGAVQTSEVLCMRVLQPSGP